MRNKTCILAVAGLAVCLLLLPSFAAGQQLSETGQPTAYTVHFKPAHIAGFGPVNFGMTMAEVEAAVADAYGEPVVTRATDDILLTPLLHVNVPDLSPVSEAASPGPAAITYVFGMTSERLTAININWYAEGEATSAQRNALLDVGTHYVAYLLGYHWQPFSTSRGIVIDSNTVILFAGRDGQGRGVEVAADGVALDVLLLPSGDVEHRPVAAGPARLRIGLSLQPDNPDVFTLTEGSF